MMETISGVYVLGPLAVALSFLVLYIIIRAAVKHGATSALREHELWMRDGSLEQTMTRRARDAERD